MTKLEQQMSALAGFEKCIAKPQHDAAMEFVTWLLKRWPQAPLDKPTCDELYGEVKIRMERGNHSLEIDLNDHYCSVYYRRRSQPERSVYLSNDADLSWDMLQPTATGFIELLMEDVGDAT